MNRVEIDYLEYIDYQPSLTERKGPDAFQLRYNSEAPAQAIENDVKSYLGEYRLGVQKYDFELEYSYGEDGLHMRSKDDKESMLKKSYRAIMDAPSSKKKRRHSEYQNLLNVENIINTANNGDLYFYFSPPDPNKEDDEGKYGFCFIGEVVDIENDENKTVKKAKVKNTAINIPSNDLQRYIQALSTLGAETTDIQTPEDFIARPFKLHSQISRADIDSVLSDCFDYTPDPQDKDRFEMIMTIMNRDIKQFVTMIKHGYSNEDILVGLYALENKALELKNIETDQLSEMIRINIKPIISTNDYGYQDDFMYLIRNYGYKPPAVGGSCGSTGETANMFGFNSPFSSLGISDYWGSSSSTFPYTNTESESKEYCVTCPYCKNKKGNYRKKVRNVLRWICGNKNCKSNKK